VSFALATSRRATKNFVTCGGSNESVKYRSRAITRTAAGILGLCVLAAAAEGQVASPRRTKDVKPVYSRESLQAGDEGAVVLELSVTASGEVEQARILWSGCKRLEQAALMAVRQWQYEHVRVNGTAVPFKVVANVPFRLPPRFKNRAGRTGACKWTDPPKPLTD
jgi:TonB family protein